MKSKVLISLLVAVSLYQPTAFAIESNNETQQATGFGIGALVGGIIAGPPGLVIGAAIGSGIGEQDNNKKNITKLEKKLSDKDKEFQEIAAEMVRINAEHQQSLHKVKLDAKKKETKDLSDRVSLSIFFRTDSASIEQQFEDSISNIASLIQQHPKINVHINAYSDIRGSGHHNYKLSLRRAQSVVQKLIENGLDSNRIQIHAFGENDSSLLNDLDSYVFDRRVDIELTLLNEV